MSKKYDYDIRDIAQFIFDCESKYDFVNRNYKGVYLWELVRVQLFEEILIQLEMMDNKVITHKRSITDVFYLFFSSVKRNRLINKKPKTLLFPSEYKSLNEGKYLDINAYKFYRNQDTAVIDYTYNDRYYPSYDTYRFLSIGLLLKKTKNKLYKKNIPLFRDFKVLAESKYGIRLDASEITGKAYCDFKIMSKQYGKILDKFRPSDVLISSFYKRHALISECKKRNILCADIQSGGISKYHMGYSFPIQKVKPRYYPNEIYSYGQFWNNDEYLRFEKYITIGFEYLQDQSVYKTRHATINTVVVMSQSKISYLLIEKIDLLCEQNPEWKFIYKLHPDEEYDGVLFRKLRTMDEKYKNFILADRSENSHNLILNASLVIATYSDAIYESLYLGCPVAITNNIPAAAIINEIVYKEAVVLIEDYANLDEVVEEGNELLDVFDIREMF